MFVVSSNLVRRLENYTKVPDGLMEEGDGGRETTGKKFPQRIKRSGY